MKQVYKTEGLFGKMEIGLKEDAIEIKEKPFGPYKKSFQAILFDDPFSFCKDLKTEYEISLYACNRLKERTDIGEEVKQRIAFYKYYQPELFIPYLYNHQVVIEECNQEVELNFTPLGLEIRDSGDIRQVIKPDRLFFAGPYVACLPIEQRQKIIDSLLVALGKDHPFGRADSFPLIDYESLLGENFRIEKDRGNTGAYLYLKKGYLYYGGWSSPRDGGSKWSDLEWFLYYGKEYFNRFTNGEFETDYETVMACIKRHIIKN